MKVSLLVRGFVLGGLAAAVFQGVGGCSTPQPAPVVPERAPEVPKHVSLPHPAGLELGDLRGVLFANSSPSHESLDGCESDVKRLREATVSQDEIRQGVRELVRRDPVRYHWCFYFGIHELDERLKVESYIDAKQKLTIGSYEFLVPVARAMLTEYRDTRYLRWATSYYQRVSEWVFFRKVGLSPEGTRELVDVSGSYVPQAGEPAPARAPAASVVEKYGIVPAAPAMERAQPEQHAIMEKEVESAPGPALGGEPPLPDSEL